jgi:chemotaxis protein MotB
MHQLSKRTGHDEEEHENHERWLVSYADMITLLAALFIVLFAMSSVNAQKFQKFAQALRGSLSGSAASAPSPSGAGPTKPVPALFFGGPSILGGLTAPHDDDSATSNAAQRAARAEHDALQGAEDRLNAQLASVGLASKVQVNLQPRGLVVSIVTDDLLFDSGSAALRTGGRSILDALAPALATLPNPISVEGHTDSRPVSGTYPSNWELSSSRAAAVLRYLVEVRGLPAPRFTATGYADQRPVAPNDTEVNRARNRRVEVVVLAHWQTSAGSP